mgnify:CR=1 FL=1
MCAYLALNYVTSSFFYFEKTLVVAQGERVLCRAVPEGMGISAAAGAARLHWRSAAQQPRPSLSVLCAVRDAASRTAWFAAINSTSAFIVLGLQLLATGGHARGARARGIFPNCP